MSNYKKLLVISSPSGGGKSTLAKRILSRYPKIKFSVSATTRKMRDGETNGIDYFFLTREEFEEKIQKNDLIEYEEIFGNLYGTLKSEVQKRVEQNETVLFDVDVKGAISLRKEFPNDTLLLFIAPPNMEVLETRLRARRTESETEIMNRLNRAQEENNFQSFFDEIILNDKLEDAFAKIDMISDKYLDPKLRS